MRLYFEKDSEIGYSLDYFEDKMKEQGIKQLELYEAERDIGEGTFYCIEFGTVGLVSDGGCGKSCNKYNPRNGKNGRCRYSRNTYSRTDKMLILKSRR